MRQLSQSLNCQMASLGWWTAVLYAALALVYDALLGDRFFLQLRGEKNGVEVKSVLKHRRVL